MSHLVHAKLFWHGLNCVGKQVAIPFFFNIFQFRHVTAHTKDYRPGLRQGDQGLMFDTEEAGGKRWEDLFCPKLIFLARVIIIAIGAEEVVPINLKTPLQAVRDQDMGNEKSGCVCQTMIRLTFIRPMNWPGFIRAKYLSTLRPNFSSYPGTGW